MGSETSALSGGGRVHVVDDDPSLRAAMVRILTAAGLRAIGHACSSELRDALRDDGPCCVVLDVGLADEDGLAVQEALRGDGSTVPVIFVTGYGTIPMTVRAMRGGAVEFLIKPVAGDVLLAAVHRALELDATAAAQRRHRRDLALRHASLTEREREVLALAIGGLMNKQIAGSLGVTEITAKVHKRHVMEKMGARSLPDLVRMAESLGITATRKR